MSAATDTRANRHFLSFLIAGLLGGQAALYLQVGLLYYAVVLIVAAVHLTRRPTEALWVGFFVFGITGQIYPVQLDELGTSLQGAYRPYILVIMVVAGSMFIGQFVRSSPTCDLRSVRFTSVWRRIGVFAALLFLTLAQSYFGSMRALGLMEILVDCSGWITFLVFLLLGNRLSASATEMLTASARFRLAVLVYSAFFVIKFTFLSLSLGAYETSATFGYSQRDVVFFSGLAFVLLTAQALTSEVKPQWGRTCLAGLVLMLAALLSGSRSVTACMLSVALLFVLVWHSKTRLRLGLLGMVVALVVLFGPPSFFPSQEGLLGYISNRFLNVSTEDTSLLAHASEMVAVADAIRENPLLGKGPLASYSFFDPLFGWKDTTFVDSGLGYLLMKTGLLGTGIFLWFAVGWLRMAQGLRRAFPTLMVVSLVSFVFYLVFLIVGPSFFEFQHAWLIGIVVGQTNMLASKFPTIRAAQIPGALNQSGALA